MIDTSDHIFPSFAASPSASPPRGHFTGEESQVHKITINLPESFVESTLDENISMEYSMKECKDETSNIKVFCRFRPSQNPSTIRHDDNMLDDGENKYTFDMIFSKHARQ
jgi:hypothetical protein